MTASLAIKLTQQLIAFLVIIQTLEYLSMKHLFNETGIWKWSDQKSEFDFLPKFFKHFYDYLFSDQLFKIFLYLRLILALIFFVTPNSLIVFVLFLTSLLLAQRFRGSFNGGSDYMSLVVLSALSFQLLNLNQLNKAILWYIALQSITSYFIAGLVKIKQKNWRTGEAIAEFINSPNYHTPLLAKQIFQKNAMGRFAAWSVMLFELLFPLILLCNKPLIIMSLTLAFLFHLTNVYLFGLNRFLLTWVATYPAIYFCSSLS